MSRLINIDFETRSFADLAKCGAYKYAEDKTTSIICMAYAVGNGAVGLWIPGQRFPKEITDALREGYELSAWNAYFEICIWDMIGVLQHGFPTTEVYNWRDSMGDAAMCSLPMGLEECAIALGCLNKKDPVGKSLITKLCKPYKGKFREYEYFKDDYLLMYKYCMQDVETEREVYHTLPAHVQGDELLIERYTWLSNMRGVPVDTHSVEIIYRKIEDYIKVLDKKITKLTEGKISGANNREKILHSLDINKEAVTPWLIDRDIRRASGEKTGQSYISKVPGAIITLVGKDVLPDVLARTDLSTYDRAILKIYSERNHAAIAKFKRIIHKVCNDSTVKDNTQYHGAGTGRDAARGVQLQNLPRASSKIPDVLLSISKEWPIEEIADLFEPLEEFTKLIRHIFKAKAGKKFLVDDYSQIEARGTAWVAKEEDILQNFRAGINPYKALAANMYQVPIDSIEEGSEMYQYGKMGELAGGYMGSHTALTDFAGGYGLVIERKTAVKVIKDFRDARPKLVTAWSAFGTAAKLAVNNPGQSFQVALCERVVFKMQGTYLTMELPSGRYIWYPHAKIENVDVPYVDGETGEKRIFSTEAITYQKPDKKKLIRKGMHGGKFLQNYVQGLCRDLVMYANIRLEQAGYEVIMRVHDEIICHVPDTEQYSTQEMGYHMCVVPPWCTNFPISSKAKKMMRYRK